MARGTSAAATELVSVVPEGWLVEGEPSAMLAIDTSTALCSVAVARPVEVLGEVTWQAGRNHTRQLLTQVENLLEVTGVAMPDLAAIAVATGPGSFNGLRVGVSTAKGLAYALSLPIVGISTLDVLAYQHREARSQICPLLNAGRGEVAHALYRAGPTHLRRITPFELREPASLVRMIDRATLFCGEVSAEVKGTLSQGLGNLARFATAASGPRRAGFLADLAWGHLTTRGPDDLMQLQPVYLRRPAVTVGKLCLS